MMKTRRQFLFECSTLTLAAGLLPTALTASVTAAKPAVDAGFAAFAAQQGTEFVVTSASSPTASLELVSATLSAVTDPQAHLAADAKNEKFTLLFRGNTSAKLAQNTYTLRHPELGELDIFIVPMRVNGSAANHYEAVFNRPAPRALV